jgi:hypothetical protein
MNRNISIIPRAIFILIAIFVITSTPAVAQVSNLNQRVALVIGNSDYIAGPLLNPVNDARAMARVLRETNFEVLEYENVQNMADMKRAIREFGEKIQNGGVGLFYYAGHGIQINGKNYLIPVKAEIYREEEVEYESVDVGFVLAQMESAHNRMNIIILDACRNNPFARSWRSASQGLAFTNAPAGTLIAYATEPGSVASDGTGENGLYTQELLKQIKKPGLKIEDVFKNVRINVMKYSDDLQTPWESSSLVGDFYFVEEEATVSATQTISTDDKSDEDILKDATDYLFPDEASLSIRWKASNNRYTALMNEKDITAETVNSGCGDDLLVYHENTRKYFLFDDFWKNQDNTYRESWSLPFDATACWRSTDNKYWFFDKGHDITSNTLIASFDEHKIIYNKQNDQYYLCAFFTQFTDGNVYPAEPVFSPNGTLWRYDGQYFYLYIDGEQIAARTFSQWNGNDLIVYDEQDNKSYLLTDLYNRKDNLLRPAEIIAGPGMITWQRQDNTYYLYRDGMQFAAGETTVADYSGNDLIVFEKTYQQTYLLKDWVNRNDQVLRNATILFSPTGVFWQRSDNNYWLYRNGQLINNELTSNWNGNDLEVYDSYLGITYILPDYAFSDDNILRAAKIK